MIAADNKKALENCLFNQNRHLYIEGSEVQLSFGESAAFATEIHFYCDPQTPPIPPPGHQQGPAQWHGHQARSRPCPQLLPSRSSWPWLRSSATSRSSLPWLR